MSLLDSLLEDTLLASELESPLKEVYLAIRTDGNDGNGTRLNPLDASTALKFDAVVAAHRAPNLGVRIGPGLFRTQGADTNAVHPLMIASGMRIVGSGMYNTTLRLTAASVQSSNIRSFAIILGSGTVNNVEISDLTIDFNLGDQPLTDGLNYARMCLKAIELNGKNNRIRRVRIINFGTRTPGQINGDRTVPSGESFPFFLGGEGMVVEDCIAEQPFLGCGRETTLFVMSGPHAVVRNNYINCAYVNPQNGFTTRVDSITVIPGSPLATIQVRTRFPHNVWKTKYDNNLPADWIELSGSDLPEFNGRWQVTAPVTEDPLSRDLEFKMTAPSGTPTSKTMTLRQVFAPTMRISSLVWNSGSGGYLNVTTLQPHFRNSGDWIALSGANLVLDNSGTLQDVINGTYQVQSAGLTTTSFRVSFTADPGLITGELWLDRRMIYTIYIQNISISGSTATVTTFGPHYLKPNEYVAIDGFQTGDPHGSGAIWFNGYFLVATVTATNAFTITGVTSPAVSPADYSQAALGFLFQGISANANTDTGLERNRILETPTGGDYKDTWPGAGAIIRKNYYYKVFNGIWNQLGGPDGANKDNPDRHGTVSSSTATDIRITAFSDPNQEGYPFEVGLIMRLNSEADPNTIFFTTITSALVGLQFSVSRSGYTSGGAPALLTFADATLIEFRQAAQINRSVVEDNIIDLQHVPLPVYGQPGGTPRGILLEFPSLVPSKVIQHAIIRRNLIRPYDNRTDPNWNDNKTSIRVTNVANAIVEHNIFSKMPPPSRTQFLWTFSLARFDQGNTFNNQNIDGQKLKMTDITRYNIFPYPFVVDTADEADSWLLGI